MTGSETNHPTNESLYQPTNEPFPLHVSPERTFSMLVESWPIDRVKPYERNPRVNDGAVDAVVTEAARMNARTSG